MKKVIVAASLATVLLLGGCIPSPGGTDDDEVVQDIAESVEETVIIPDVQLKDEYYRTLLPFKKSASRGLILNNIRTKYDIKEAEEGLLRLSTDHFNTKDHFFQEGQYIDEKTARSWIQRKSDDNEAGLNPSITSEMTEDEIAIEAPSYLAHIVEQNFLVMTDEKKVRLDGISIGLALNSVHYTKTGSKTSISDAILENQGKVMAEEIVTRLRSKEGLENIPIMIGLFKQESRDAIVPGAYFLTAIAEKGKSLSNWKPIDEEYVLFPASSNDEKYREVNTSFLNFKQAIDEYFPSFVNVIGRGLYENGSLESLNIEIPIQFFGTSETIGFTQYLTGLLSNHLPNVRIEISVTSVNGPEALIIKDPSEAEPLVHIYGY